jgi:ribosomal protein L37AE/L43A
MKKCHYCGRDNADEAVNCRECGTEFEQPVEAAVPEEPKTVEVLLSEHLPAPSGVRKCLASLEVGPAVGLLEQLKKAGIPAEAQAVTQEGGLDYRDIMVVDHDYERACDVAEDWEAERREDEVRQLKQFCPRCGSRHLEYITTETFGSIWNCKDCGNSFAK